jgi:hypothetical protein
MRACFEQKWHSGVKTGQAASTSGQICHVLTTNPHLCMYPYLGRSIYIYVQNCNKDQGFQIPMPLVQQTKAGKIYQMTIPNITYQMATKYTKWP